MHLEINVQFIQIAFLNEYNTRTLSVIELCLNIICVNNMFDLRFLSLFKEQKENLCKVFKVTVTRITVSCVM